MIGSEDLALAKHSILIITSGDLGTVFSQVTQDHQNHNWHQKLIEQHEKHQHVKQSPITILKENIQGAGKANPGSLWALDMRAGGADEPVSTLC